MSQIELYQANNDLQFSSVGAILWRRKWIMLAVFGTIAALGFFYATFRSQRYDATAQMIVTQRGMSVSTTTEPTASSIVPSLPETPQTQMSMIMSDGMAQRTFNQLKNDAVLSGKSPESLGVTEPGDFRLEFAQIVKVTNPLDTNLLEVTVTQKSPQLAATWANAICQAFLQWKKDLARQTVDEIAGSLRKRVNGAREQMIASEKAETAYKQQHHLVDVSTEQQAALGQYIQRDVEAQTAEQELAALQSRLKAVGTQLKTANEAIRLSKGVRDDAGVKLLQAELSDLQQKRAEAALKYTDAYPNMLQDMDDQIADVQKRLTDAVQGTLNNKRPSLEAQGILNADYDQTSVLVKTGEAKVAAAVAERDKLKANLVGLPQTMLEYTRLSRNAELARQLYSTLLLPYNSAILNADTVTGNVQVTQAAFPPILPSGLTTLRLAIIVVLSGLLLAFGAALLVERSDHRIRTVDQVRGILGGPVVGTLPPFSRRQMKRLLQGHTPPEVIEAYGLTRANLALAIRGATEIDPLESQSILITSALPGEGKSVTAAELARSIARAGKSVILVDADMRRSMQDRLFSPTTNLGLADVLTGQATLEAALGAPVTKNLSLLQSGSLSYNPTEMMSRPQMAQILARLQEMANVVIVDAPACALVADALLLAPHVECILQVIGTGQADEDLVRDTAIALQAAAPKTLAFFVNRAPRQRTRRYRSYYHHAISNGNNGNGLHPPADSGEAVVSLPGLKQENSDRIAKK